MLAGNSQSYRLAGPLGPRVSVHPGQEDGARGHVYQGRGPRAPLLGQGLKPTDSVPSGRRGLRLGGLSSLVGRRATQKNGDIRGAILGHIGSDPDITSEAARTSSKTGGGG